MRNDLCRPLRADEKLPVRRHREQMSPSSGGVGEGDIKKSKHHKKSHKDKHKVNVSLCHFI